MYERMNISLPQGDALLVRELAKEKGMTVSALFRSWIPRKPPRQTGKEPAQAALDGLRAKLGPEEFEKWLGPMARQLAAARSESWIAAFQIAAPWQDRKNWGREWEG